MSKIPAEMPKDLNGYPMQIGHWDTSATAQYLDGTSAAANSEVATRDLQVRLQVSNETDCWVKIGDGVTAISGEGALIPAGFNESTVIREGERLSVIGGKINIVIYD